MRNTEGMYSASNRYSDFVRTARLQVLDAFECFDGRSGVDCRSIQYILKLLVLQNLAAEDTFGGIVPFEVSHSILLGWFTPK